MKICITGAHSTGKTTLINSFIESHLTYNCYVIEEIARKVINDGFTLGKEATIESYLNYINKQLQAEIASTNIQFDFLLSDRSLIDGVAHPIVNNKLVHSFHPNYFIELFESILFFQKSFYDVYVYIPIEFKMSPDKVRPNDDAYREAIDLEIKRLLDKHIKRYYTITGSLYQRISQLENIMNTHH